MYIEVAQGREEVIERITGSRTTLRPDWNFVSDLKEADFILTDNPAKFYPTPKHVNLVCTHAHGMVNPGEDWGGPFAITHILFDEPIACAV